MSKSYRIQLNKLLAPFTGAFLRLDMIIPDYQRKEITSGLLPLLLPIMEPGTELISVSGNTLISNGVQTDVKGKLIVGSRKYLYPITKMLPVNHAFKIAELIEKAADPDEMHLLLAQYLNRYGDHSKF